MTTSSQHAPSVAEGLSSDALSRILSYTVFAQAEVDPPVRSYETNEATLPGVHRIERSVGRVLKRLEALNSR